MYARKEWQNGLQNQSSVWNANADGIMSGGFFLAVALYFVSMVRDGSCSQQNFVQEGLSLSNCWENKTNKKPQITTTTKKSKPTQPQNNPPCFYVFCVPVPLRELSSSPHGTEWERL